MMISTEQLSRLLKNKITFYTQDSPKGLCSGETIPLGGISEEGLYLTQGRQEGGWRVSLLQEGDIVHLAN